MCTTVQFETSKSMILLIAMKMTLEFKTLFKQFMFHVNA